MVSPGKGSLLWLPLLWLACCSANGQVLETLISTGPSTNRYNVVFLSEGYTTNQVTQFRTDATNAMRLLLRRAPFDRYRYCINWYSVFVPSAQSGSDHPAYGSYRTTYFNSSYDTISDRLITIPPNQVDADYSHGQGKIDTLLQSLVPRCHVPILLVNDLTPGGSDGAGRVAISYRGAGIIDFLAHEIAHVMAGLGDEYTDQNPGFPNDEEPNTTTNLNAIKWIAWVPSGTPIPTPQTAEFASTVGVFEGAHYHSNGWYRPKLDCTMNHPGFPEYCEVCREALVLSLYRNIRPIDVFTPSQTNVVVRPGQPENFKVSLTSSNLVIGWYMDGTLVPGAANTNYSPSLASLTPGAHSLTGVVHDGTELVRSDPENLLWQTVNWRLYVEPPLTSPEVSLKYSVILPGALFAFCATNTCTNPATFILQSSTVPEPTSWISVSTNILASGAGLWFTNAIESSGRFYRANFQPTN